MFMPGRDVQAEKEAQKKTFQKVEQMCIDLVPEQLRASCTIAVQEIQCGDPQCAPIDTAITILFESGGQGMFGMPMEAKEVTPEELEEHFPPPRILEKWHKGEEAEWPEPEPLRFIVNQKVLCRVGPTDWAPGTVIQLWYREPQWPPQSFAPYKIRLDDGRDIFAPADIDQVIKLNPDAQQPLEEIE